MFYDEKRFHISIASKPGENLVANDELNTINISSPDMEDEDDDDDDDEISSVITVEGINVRIGNRIFEMLFTSGTGYDENNNKERKLVEIHNNNNNNNNKNTSSSRKYR